MESNYWASVFKNAGIKCEWEQAAIKFLFKAFEEAVDKMDATFPIASEKEEFDRIVNTTLDEFRSITEGRG